VPPLDRERVRVLETGVGRSITQRWRRDIQGNRLPGSEQARCEAEHGKFTKVSLGSSQNRHGTERRIISTHSDDLLDVERAHIAPVGGGAGPLGVQHCDG
jgi:hypothetical protein